MPRVKRIPIDKAQRGLTRYAMATSRGDHGSLVGAVTAASGMVLALWALAFNPDWHFARAWIVGTILGLIIIVVGISFDVPRRKSSTAD
jgi:hypothetical protein